MAHFFLNTFVRKLQSRLQPLNEIEEMSDGEKRLKDEYGKAVQIFSEIYLKKLPYQKWTSDVKKLYNKLSFQLNGDPLISQLLSNARITNQPLLLERIQECKTNLSQNGWIGERNVDYQDLLLFHAQNPTYVIDDNAMQLGRITKSKLPQFRIILLLSDSSHVSTPISSISSQTLRVTT